MDDDLNYVRRNQIVHHGSLADSLQLGRPRNDDDTEPPGEEEGNVERSTEFLPMEDHQNPLDQGNKEVLEEMERKKRARLIQVSTDDSEVKKDLRHLGEPICLFGEGPAERRNRLRELLSERGERKIVKSKPQRARKIIKVRAKTS